MRGVPARMCVAFQQHIARLFGTNDRTINRVDFGLRLANEADCFERPITSAEILVAMKS